jgi:RimJ/RimL family protein N-acetyltransferase
MGQVSLEPASDEDFRWLLGEAAATRPLDVAPGLTPPEVLAIVRQLPANWLVVARGELVGIIGLKTDSSQEVEIGYGIASSREGRGFASAALAALLPVLQARAVRLVTAETSVDNPASQRVLERNGFVRWAERTDDEDGPLYCWRRPLL